MSAHRHHTTHRIFRTLLGLPALFIGLLVFSGTAAALPSCPTLIYEGASPAAGGLIDPGRPTVTFRFNRKIVPYSVTGGSFPVPVTTFPPRIEWKNFPKTVLIYDDYGIQIPSEVTVIGNTVNVKPMIDLKPNKQYRFLIQGIASPILGEYPDDISRVLCSRPSIRNNIAADYNTRPTATGGCLTGPTPVTTTRYGLTPGCKYNLTYLSSPASNEDEEYIDMTWAWGHVRPTLRMYTAYPISESRGVQIEVTNLAWNGSYWVAQSAVATATGSANTPQSKPEGSVIATYNNVIMAYRDSILLFENYYVGKEYGSYDLTISSGVRGTVTLSPGI